MKFSRISSLDGLRGWAALVVLLSHLGQGLLPGGEKLLLGGQLSVFTFFVISGFVMTQALGTADLRRWVYYFPARLIRLYVPCVLAILFAAGALLLIPHDGDYLTSSVWIQGVVLNHWEWKTVWESFILGGSSFPDVIINPPLWSLSIEIVFSMLLPVYVFWAWRVRKFPLLPLLLVPAVLFGPLVILGFRNPAYGLIFLIGASMAFRDRDEIIARKFSSKGFLPLVLFIFFVALVVENISSGPSQSVYAACVSFDVLVATFFVLGALHFKSFTDFLNLRFSQYLGKISFSLYLFHFPILASFLFIFSNPTVVLVCTLITSFSVATLAQRFIEVPVMKLSHSVGSRGRVAE